MYAPYYRLLEAKKKCFPPSKIVVTKTSADIQFQSFLNHTITRVAELQNDVLLASFKPNVDLHMLYKCGADGSGSQSN